MAAEKQPLNFISPPFPDVKMARDEAGPAFLSARLSPQGRMESWSLNTPLSSSGTNRLSGLHRQVVFTIPRMLRIFFKYNRRLLGELFAREVLGFLVHKELLSPEWADRLLSWRHTGFNVHGRVRAKTKAEAERVGKYMARLNQCLNDHPTCAAEKELPLSKRLMGHWRITHRTDFRR